MEKSIFSPTAIGFPDIYIEPERLEEKYRSFENRAVENGYPLVLKQYREAVDMIALTRDQKLNKQLVDQLKSYLSVLYKGESDSDGFVDNETIARSSYMAYRSTLETQEAVSSYVRGNASSNIRLDDGQIYNEAYRALGEIDPLLLNRDAIHFDKPSKFYRTPLDKYPLRVKACKDIGLDRNHPVFQLAVISWLSTSTRRNLMNPLLEQLKGMHRDKSFSRYKTKADSPLSDEELYWHKLLVSSAVGKQGAEFYRGYYQRLDENKGRILESVDPEKRASLVVLAETVAYMKPIKQLGRPVSAILREALMPAVHGDYDKALDGLAGIVARSEKSMPKFPAEIFVEKVKEQKHLKYQQEGADVYVREQDAKEAEVAVNRKTALRVWREAIANIPSSKELEEFESMLGIKIIDGPIELEYTVIHEFRERIDYDKWSRYQNQLEPKIERREYKRTLRLGEPLVASGKLSLRGDGVGMGSVRNIKKLLAELKTSSVVDIKTSQQTIEDYIQTKVGAESAGLQRHKKIFALRDAIESVRSDPEGDLLGELEGILGRSVDLQKLKILYKNPEINLKEGADTPIFHLVINQLVVHPEDGNRLNVRVSGFWHGQRGWESIALSDLVAKLRKLEVVGIERA